MGHSIDVAAKTWRKEMKINYRPKEGETLVQPEKEEEYDIWNDYFHVLKKHDGLTYMGKFNIYNFDQQYFDMYKENSEKFLEEVKRMPSNAIQHWFLNQKGKLIHFDYDKFISSPMIEQYKTNKWVYSDLIHLKEDGKLLSMAEDNLSSRYGISLSPVMISKEEIMNYDENDEYASYLDEKISWDTSDLAVIMEFALKNMKKKPEDEFFEERMPRLKLLHEAIKQGGKLIYSY